MSARDFQLALASLIASPEACYRILKEGDIPGNFTLTDKERHRLLSIISQRGMSACCSLYRMNRVTPVYSQLSNTCMLLREDLIPLVEEFWQYLSKPSLQFREEVLEFAAFLMKKIDTGEIDRPYLKEVLQLETAMNELSYLPEGEQRILHFEHNILIILRTLADGKELVRESVPKFASNYRLYIKNDKMEMEEFTE